MKGGMLKQIPLRFVAAKCSYRLLAFDAELKEKDLVSAMGNPPLIL
jgi:hypothetical protein